MSGLRFDDEDSASCKDRNNFHLTSPPKHEHKSWSDQRGRTSRPMTYE